MSDIKIIAFDLDGTLLTEKKTLTPRTALTLKHFADTGTLLVVCTGRALIGVPDDVSALKGCKYMITANGAAVYEKKDDCSYTLISEHLMDNQRARELMRRLSAYRVMPDPFIDGKCFMYADKRYLIDMMDVSAEMRDYVRMSRTPVENMDEFLSDKKIQKITINFASYPDGHRIDYDETVNILSDYPEFTKVTGGIKNIEVSDVYATKGNALMELSSSLDISPDEIIAFGDSENDISMLKAAGTGVAMANSLDITIKAADAVTSSNDEEGVARFLEGIMGQYT